jgi:hypothetical protein
MINPLKNLDVRYRGVTGRQPQVIDIAAESGRPRIAPVRKSSQPNANRGAFWKFSIRAAGRTRGALTAHDIDKLFVDQEYRCAVSGILFDPPVGGARGKRLPFTPSLDRITAGGPYEVGNIRLVCAIVNFAMNEWGENALHRLVAEMSIRGAA